MKTKFFLLIFLFSVFPTVCFAAQSVSSFTGTGTSTSLQKSQTTAVVSEPSTVSQPIQDQSLSPDLKLDNTIDVGSPGVKKINLAIPEFVTSEESKTAVKAFTARMVSILNFTNWFSFIPQENFIAPANAALLPFVQAQWKSIGAEYVIFGKLTASESSKNTFSLELRLFDVKSGNQILGRMYSRLSTQTADLALRKFGDALVAVLTGAPGPFLSRIAFVGREKAGGNSQIFVADFDGKNPIKITNNKSINMSPAWSADGTKLSYTSFASGKPEIYLYNFITKKNQRITSGLGNNSGSNWSPTGTQIAFSSSTGAGKTHIFTMNQFGGNKKVLVATSDIEVEPAFSPDGNLLAYTSAKFGKPMIFIKNLKTGQSSRITYAGWYNASARWSPDGKHLAFASYDRDIDRWDLFKINPNGSNLERLTLNQGDNEQPSWSPDGRFILFQSDRTASGAHGGKHRLFVMSADGSYQMPLAINLPDVRQPVWGPRLTSLELELEK